MLVRGLAQEGRFYFSREAARGNGTFKVFYVATVQEVGEADSGGRRRLEALCCARSPN
jgi:hypothetical protein